MFVLLGLRVSFECSACRGRANVTAVDAASAHCRMCGEDLAYDGAVALVRLLATVPSPSVFDRGMDLDDGSRIDGLSQQPDVHVTLLGYGQACPACRHVWQDEDIDASGASGHQLCAGCGARYRFEVPPPVLQALTPRLRFVLRADDAIERSQVRREGVTVDCGGCGAALLIDAGSTQIECRFCGRQNQVGGASSAGHGSAMSRPRPTLFFVCAWRPEEVLARQQRVQQDQERARLVAHYEAHPEEALADAANPATPLSVLAFLAWYPDAHVRAVVATNGSVPIDLLKVFVTDRAPVAGALATRSDLPDEMLARLCGRTELTQYLSQNPVKGRYLAQRLRSRWIALRAMVVGWVLTAIWLLLCLLYGSWALWIATGVQAGAALFGAIAAGEPILAEEIARRRLRPMVVEWLSVVAIATSAVLVQLVIYFGWTA